MAETAAAAPTSKWRDLLAAPAMKWVLLVPTALSAIANLEGIGKVAHGIVALWRPVHDQLTAVIASLVPETFPLSAEALAVHLLFLPFTLSRVYEMARGRELRHHFLVGCAGIFSFLFLFAVQSSGFNNIPWYLYQGVFTIYLLIWIALKITLKGRLWTALVAPIAMTVGVSAILISLARKGMVPDFPITLVSLIFLYAFPLINPQRLTQVALIAAAILGISMSYEWIGTILPT